MIAECKIELGDARSLRFADDYFDLVFTSPPYEAQRKYGELGFNLKGDDWVQWCADCYLESLRVCRGLVCYVVEGCTRNFRYSNTPLKLAVELERRGVLLRKPAIFRRQGIPGTGGPDYLRNDYEFIICGTKRGRLEWSNNTAMGKPTKKQRDRKISNYMANGKRKSGVYRDPDIANPGNVIWSPVGYKRMGWDGSHLNEASFPECLVEFFVLSFCKPGGHVLDPFSGSGTTIAVALKNGRNGIGIDKRKSQVKLGRKRLAEIGRLGVQSYLDFAS